MNQELYLYNYHLINDIFLAFFEMKSIFNDIFIINLLQRATLKCY
jgi:hypothetical protein